jgi:hypothetical protein
LEELEELKENDEDNVKEDVVEDEVIEDEVVEVVVVEDEDDVKEVVIEDEVEEEEKEKEKEKEIDMDNLVIIKDERSEISEISERKVKPVGESFKGMKVEQLRTLAIQRGFEPKNLKKHELIELLESQ